MHRALASLHLLADDHLPSARAALLFACLAWAVPAGLCALDGTLRSPVGSAPGYLSDPAVHARFGVAIVILLLFERVADRRATMLLRQFARSGLIPAERLERYRAALLRAAGRSCHPLADTGALLFAFFAALAHTGFGLATLGASWQGSMVDGAPVLSPAGWWCLLVSFPLFWFLVFRWSWRFFIGTRLLYELSRSGLRLLPTHPDRCGGLGFLGQFPGTFMPLVFAMHCVAAATTFKLIGHEELGIKFIAGCQVFWLLVAALALAGPLMVFARPLNRSRRRALLEYGALLTCHNHAFERKWLQRGDRIDELLVAGDISSVADFAAVYERAQLMRLVPVDHRTLISIAAICSLPWLPVLATRVPLVAALRLLSKALL